MPSNVSSEQIHNHNCYLYLRAITNEKQLPESIQSILPKRLGYQLNIVLKQNQYEPDYRYADLYRDFFAFIDSESEKIASRKKV